MSEPVNVVAEGRRLVEAFYVTIGGEVALEDADWVDVKWALSEACDHIERLEARVKELEGDDAGLNIAMKAAAETVNLVMNLDPHWHPPQGDRV